MKIIGKSVWTILTVILCFILIFPVSLSVGAQSIQEIEAGSGPDFTSFPLTHEAESTETTTAISAVLTDYPYVSHIFTVADVVFFSYEDGTMVALYDSSGGLIWNNGGSPLNKGGHAHVAVGEGVYTAKGSTKFAVLSGDPITRYVVGYYAMDQNGYGTSTELYTWVPQLYQHCSFIVFAYQDNTQVTVEDTDTGVDVATFTLNKGKHWQIETLDTEWLHVTANKPVSALTCYDQGYLVPAANGKWSGREFYTYLSDIAGWPEDLTVVAYNDNTSVTIKDSDTGSVIWSGNLNSGQAHVQGYPSGADRFFTVTSSKVVSVYAQPWVSRTSGYHQGAYLGDSTGTRLGTDLIGSTLNGGYLYILAYRDNTSVVIYNSQTGAFAASYTLDDAEYIQANPGNGLWRIMSNYPISAYSGYGQWNAEFAPIEFREVTAIDVTVSTDKDSYTPSEDIIISAKVTDADGNPLYPLTVGNFQVFVDGIEATMENFAMVTATDYRLEISAPETAGDYVITVVVNTEVGSASGTAPINVYTISSVSLTIGGNRLTQYENSVDTPVYYRADSGVYPEFEISVDATSEIADDVQVAVRISDHTGVKPTVTKVAVYRPDVSKYRAEWKGSTDEYPVGRYEATAEVSDLNGNLLCSSAQKEFYLVFKPPTGYENLVSATHSSEIHRASGTPCPDNTLSGRFAGTKFYYLHQFEYRNWKPALDKITGIVNVDDAARSLLLYAHGIDDSFYGYWHSLQDERQPRADLTHNNGDWVAGTFGWARNYAAVDRWGYNLDSTPGVFDGGPSAWWYDVNVFLDSDFRPNDPNGNAPQQRPMGVCADYAPLLVSNARSAGIPAREISGAFVGPSGHAVTEIYYGGAWHHYDPTWNESDSPWTYSDQGRYWEDYLTKQGSEDCSAPVLDRADFYNYIVETTDISFDKDDYDYPDDMTVTITIENTGNIDIRSSHLHLTIWDKPTILELGPSHLIDDITITGTPADPLSVGETLDVVGYYELPDYGWLNGVYETIGDRYIVAQIEYVFDRDGIHYVHTVHKLEEKVPGLCPDLNPTILVDGSPTELSTSSMTSFSFNETTNESTEMFIEPQGMPATVEHKAKYSDQYIREHWHLLNPDAETHDYELVRPLIGIGDAAYIPGYGSVTANQTLDVVADHVVMYDTTAVTDGPISIYAFSCNMTLKEVAIFDGALEVIATRDFALATESGEAFLIYSSMRDGGGMGFEQVYESFAEEIIGNGDTLTHLFIEGEDEGVSYYRVGDAVYVDLCATNNGVLDETRELGLTINMRNLSWAMTEDGVSSSDIIVYNATETIVVPAKGGANSTFEYWIPDDPQLGLYRVTISDGITEATTVFFILAPFEVVFDCPADVTQSQEFQIGAEVTNMLDTPLSDIEATLELPNDFETAEPLTKNIGTLSAGSNASVSWLVTSTDFEYGYSPIAIYFETAEGISDTATTSVNVLRLPTLHIASYSPSEVQKGVPFEFTIAVSNEGDLEMEGVTATVSLPENVTTADDIVELIGYLGPMETKSVTWLVTPDRYDDFCLDVGASDTTGLYTASAVEIVNVIASDFALEFDSPVEVTLGDDFPVLLRIENIGELEAANVSVSLILPSEFDTLDPAEVNAGSIAPGEVGEIGWTLTGVNPGYGEITANVTSSSFFITKGVIVTSFPLTVETDKEAYEGEETVIITMTVRNDNPEVSYVELLTDVVVEGPGIEEPYSIPIDYISGAETRNFALAWDSTGKPSGNYTVGATLLQDTVVLNQTSVSFILTSDQQPPVADAGPDQTVYVTPPATTVMVTLDGSGSYDPNDDPLTYNWTWDGNIADSVSPTVELPLGTTTITLVVNDGMLDSEPDTVDIAVEIPPTMHCTPKYFFFVAREDGENPQSRTLTIYNFGAEGCAPLEWTVSDGADWLTLSPTSGTTMRTIPGDQVDVSVNISGMPAGTYFALITIEAPGATNTPQQLPVFLYIRSSSPPLFSSWRFL